MQVVPFGVLSVRPGKQANAINPFLPLRCIFASERFDSQFAVIVFLREFYFE